MTGSPNRTRAWLKRKGFLFGMVLLRGVYLYIFLIFVFPCMGDAGSRVCYAGPSSLSENIVETPSWRLCKRLEAASTLSYGFAIRQAPSKGIQGEIEEDEACLPYPDMRMNATPNPVGSGARALGVGGAFIAIADDATAASWNPGALLNLKRPELSIVGSYFSGTIAYHVPDIPGEGKIKNFSDDLRHLNHLSLACPFVFFQRNMVISLNYQHLYEFSLNTSHNWRFQVQDPSLDIPMTADKRQKGSLKAISPALAIQVIPSLHLGVTANFWPDDELDNGWENLNIIEGKGGLVASLWKANTCERVSTYARLYERYAFSGFNTNIGFLWRLHPRLTFGGVLKTPFEADVRHTCQYLSRKVFSSPCVSASLREIILIKPRRKKLIWTAILRYLGVHRNSLPLNLGNLFIWKSL